MQQGRRTASTEGRLGGAATKNGEVGTFALLQEDDRDQKEADDDMDPVWAGVQQGFDMDEETTMADIT